MRLFSCTDCGQGDRIVSVILNLNGVVCGGLCAACAQRRQTPPPPVYPCPTCGCPEPHVTSRTVRASVSGTPLASPDRVPPARSQRDEGDETPEPSKPMFWRGG